MTTAPAVSTVEIGPVSREAAAFASLVGLCGLAVTQPALELLGNNTEIIVVRDLDLVGALAVSLVIALLPPAVLYAVEVVIGLLLPRGRRALHALLAGGLLGLLALEVAKRTTGLGEGALVAVAVAGGLVGTLLTLRARWVTTWSAYLAAAPPIFIALFLTASPAAEVLAEDSGVDRRSRSTRPHRVVLVVFDELPLGTLLDGSGRVDAELFPNFASLAGSSTWYRNSIGSAAYTRRAVPAILTGRFPESGDALPITADHPVSIFSMLGDYSMNVHESETRVCPRVQCGRDRTDGTGIRPALSDTVSLWRGFASPTRTPLTPDALAALVDGPRAIDRFAASLRPGSGRRLDLLHAIAPHNPWHFYADGTDYEQYQPPPGMFGIWGDGPQAAQARVRHVVQTMDVDRRLGGVLRRLRTTGAWDDALVIVMSDHGVAFRAREGVRAVTGDNWPEIMWTPLFVKYPGQRAGTIDDRPAQAVDVLPTIAAVVGARVPPGTDGRSLLGPVRSPDDRRFYQYPFPGFEPAQTLRPPNGRNFFEFDESRGFAEVLASAAAPRGGHPKLRPFRIGPFGTLIGREVESLISPEGPIPGEFSIDDPQRILAARPRPGHAPWGFLRGFVSGAVPGGHLAVAVNGRVVATTRATRVNEVAQFWSALIEPSPVRVGTNIVKLFAVQGTPEAPALREIPYAGAADL